MTKQKHLMQIYLQLKILLNSVLRTPEVKLIAIDIKNCYLEITLKIKHDMIVLVDLGLQKIKK